MAIRNNRIFGLAVPLSLADIPDREEALLNLGLNQEDLEIIRGASAAGFDSQDLQTLSNLSSPIYKTFDRYITDVLTYNSSLGVSAGSDVNTRGNLQVNGPIYATAFRYTLLDTISNTIPTLRWGDISTSRVSSWSSIGDSIAYGADVEIGGKLSIGKLTTKSVPIARNFPAEQVTHKIAVNINGSLRYIYAMKGIPLRFLGYFRNFSAEIKYPNIAHPPNAWRIYRKGTTSYEDYLDSSATLTSIINYSSPIAAEKYIEIYSNPADLTYLSLQNSSILEIPKTRLINLETFNFASNGLTEFPDFVFLTPKLLSLSLVDNRFFNGRNIDERYFSRKIAKKLPTTLRFLSISGCFEGPFIQHVLNRLTSLRNISSRRTAFNPNAIFYPNSLNPSGQVPNFHGRVDYEDITHQIEVVDFYDSDFRSFGSSLQGGVEEVTVTSSGSNYPPGSYINRVIDATKGFSINYAVTSTGQINPSSIEINNPGTGGYVGNESFTIPDPVGGAGVNGVIQITKLVYTQSIKEQRKLRYFDLSENNNLVDNNFQLASSTTLEGYAIEATQISIPNTAGFTKLISANFSRGTNKKSFYQGWDNGLFGDPSAPISDTEGFKFANCTSLVSVNANYTDVVGYLPKFIGCDKLTTLGFYDCAGLIAGRPGKRGIRQLFQIGSVSTIGTFSVTGTTGEFQRNIDLIVFDSDPPIGGSAASVRVTTNSSGNITNVLLVSRGSGYTNPDTILITGAQLNPTVPLAAGNRNLSVSVNGIIQAVIQDGTGYPGAANSTNTYTDSGLGVGKQAQISVTFNALGFVSSYAIINPGREYEDFDYDGKTTYITINGNSISAGKSNLQIRIQTVDEPKLIYNDQFDSNPLFSSLDLYINNPKYGGKVEPNAFVPCKNTLSYLRFEVSNRKITGNFFNLSDAPSLEVVYSQNQGWTGNLPNFPGSFKLRDVRLQGNNFSGLFDYRGKSALYYLDLSNNKIEEISILSTLPALQFFYMGNNSIGVKTDTELFPPLASIMPNARNIELQNNRISRYTSGVEELSKLEFMNLSGNRMSRGQVDAILFAFEKNYNKYPRRGTIIDLRGSEMGAPTPYPVTNGIISGIVTTGATVSNGNVTIMGDAIAPSGYVPVTGRYSNLAVSYVSGSGTGTSAIVTLNVTSTYAANVVNAINSAAAVYTGTFPPNRTQTFTSIVDTRANSVGTGARITVTIAPDLVDPINSPSRITSITLVNGGTGYQNGNSITVASSSIGGTNGFLTVPITGIRKRVYSGVDWTFTINNGGSNYNTFASDSKTMRVPLARILFEDENGNQVSGYIQFRIASITSFTNTAAKTGFGAAEYLRRNGWTINTN